MAPADHGARLPQRLISPVKVLLTGATGYIGKHLLARLLRDGCAVYALVRDPDGRGGARLASALRPFGLPADRCAPPYLHVIAGDITAPGCGIDAADYAVLAAADCTAVVHCAGLTRFDAHLASEVTLHNLEGTQRLYTLARELGVPAVHHVSTAFVAGASAHGLGNGELECGQHFNNPYEASKFAAEQWLRARPVQGAPVTTIYRPSIVVGGCPIGENNAVSTVYTFMKAVHFVRECCRRDAARGRGAFARLGFEQWGEDFHIPLRVAADPETRVNLVAIEDVVDCIVDGVTHPPARATTVTLTGPEFRIANLSDAITRTFRLDGVRLVAADAFEHRPRNALEAQFHRITQVYTPYLFHPPRFDPSHSAARRPLDPARLASEFRHQFLGDRAPRDEATVGSLAVGALGISHPRDYFAALVQGRVGRHFLARHPYVDADLEFALSGEQPYSVRLHFRDGGVTEVTHPPQAAADCRYELSSALFMRIIAGETDLRTAFLSGKVRVRGNVELALKFGALFGRYYQHIDEHVIDELTV